MVNPLTELTDYRIHYVARQSFTDLMSARRARQETGGTALAFDRRENANSLDLRDWAVSCVLPAEVETSARVWRKLGWGKVRGPFGTV
jgi:hypothetical protein